MDVLVLLSGGIDSTAMLHYYTARGDNCSVLFVDYGQESNKLERESVKRIVSFFHIKGIQFITLVGSEKHGMGYIRGRNGFLLMAALMNCPFNNGVIAIGIHADVPYMDCLPNFVNSMQSVFDVYESGAIQIGAPFLQWSKSDIVSYFKENKLPGNLTYSCELGLEQPCGQCLSCKDIGGLNNDQ